MYFSQYMSTKLLVHFPLSLWRKIHLISFSKRHHKVSRTVPDQKKIFEISKLDKAFIWYTMKYYKSWASQGALTVKNLTANAGDVRDVGSVLGLGRLPWRRQWQPSPVFLSAESHGQKSLVGYSPQGHKELYMTEATQLTRTVNHIFKQKSENTQKKWPKSMNGKFTNGATQNINKNRKDVQPP